MRVIAFIDEKLCGKMSNSQSIYIHLHVTYACLELYFIYTLSISDTLKFSIKFHSFKYCYVPMLLLLLLLLLYINFFSLFCFLRVLFSAGVFTSVIFYFRSITTKNKTTIGKWVIYWWWMFTETICTECSPQKKGLKFNFVYFSALEPNIFKNFARSVRIFPKAINALTIHRQKRMILCVILRYKK